MSGESDDPIKRRADEIRAEEAAAAKNESTRDADLRSERVRVAQQFLDALTEQTTHSAQCVSVDDRPHSIDATFNFLREGKIWTQRMFEFGVDRIDGEPGSRRFLYYLEPSGAAFGIPHPSTGVARTLSNAPLADVIAYAVAISIEMMAQVVASGGTLGTVAELNAAITTSERHEQTRRDAAKRERRSNFWTGCGTSILIFFGFFVALGVLSSIMRSCSGS